MGDMSLFVGVGDGLVLLLPGKGARHGGEGQDDSQTTPVERAEMFQIPGETKSKRRDKTSSEVLPEQNENDRSRSSNEARGEVRSWICGVEK